MAPRTLLLAPPSISAHPEVLEKVYEIHHRDYADLQMLDRLAAGLVQLPSSTYDVVLLLTDADGTTRESHTLLARNVMNKVVGALKAGGVLKSQDGIFGSGSGAEKTEAILAGLVEGGDGMMKPEDAGSVSIPLKLRKKTNGTANGTNGATNGTDAVPLNINGKRKEPEPVKPMGVGFVDFSDDLDDPIITGEDDDLIDEDDLITEEDMARPVMQRTSLPQAMRTSKSNSHSTGVSPQSRKATPRLQRLHLRYEGEDRSRGCRKARNGRQSPRYHEVRCR